MQELISLLRLKRAHYIDPPSYCRYKSATAYNADWTSTTEAVVLWQMNRYAELRI